MAGSHASVANGLLASGVAGVIATSVPIPALEAAAFVARLIYRIDTFLPLQLNSLDSRVCWREFINKMFRMSYSTDILRAYRDDKPQWITESQYVQIHQLINMEINSGNLNWHYVLFEQLVRASGKTLEDIKNRFIRSIRFKHSAFYVQMGRSDKIFLIKK